MDAVTTDLAAAIQAKVAEERVVIYGCTGQVPRFNGAMCDLADAILARHVPGNGAALITEPTFWVCTGCGHPEPCPEKRDLATAWGVEP